MTLLKRQFIPTLLPSIGLKMTREPWFYPQIPRHCAEVQERRRGVDPQWHPEEV